MLYFQTIVIFASLQYLACTRMTKEEEDAQKYLKTFGYIPTLDQNSPSSLMDTNGMQSHALRKFQKFSHLRQTGVLDADTMQKMGDPRCGVPDNDVSNMADSRIRLYFESQWTKELITWAIVDFDHGLDQGIQRRAITESLIIWQQVIPLRFQEVNPGNKDIDVRLKFGSYEHGDYYPFDGPGRVLAHAFGPNDGRTHFDTDERWVYKEDIDRTIELVTVAVHEIGHVLGLSHSEDNKAIMAPFYQRFYDQNLDVVPRLNDDDIWRIQQLYGGKNQPVAPAVRPPVTKAPEVTTTTRSVRRKPTKRHNNCPNRIDTVLSTSSQLSQGLNLLLFSDFLVYTYSGSSVELMGDIRDVFQNGPYRVTRTLYAPVDKLVLLFEGLAGRKSLTFLPIFYLDRKIYGYHTTPINGKFKMHQDFPKILTSELHHYTTAFTWSTGIMIFPAENNICYVWDDGRNQVTDTLRTSDYFPKLFETAPVSFSYGGRLHFIQEGRVIKMDQTGLKVDREQSEYEFFKCYNRARAFRHISDDEPTASAVRPNSDQSTIGTIFMLIFAALLF